MNLAVLAERNLDSFGEYVTLVFEGREYTNVEMAGAAERFASALAGLGVAPGDRVGVMMPNVPEINAVYGGVFRCGAVNLPMMFLLAPPEIRHILEDSGAAAIVTSPEFYANVATAIDGLERPPLVIVAGEPVPDGALAYTALLDAAQPSFPIVPRDGDDLAVVMYTSGTTGRPKGVMLTHANILFNSENSAKVVATRDGDTSIVCLPLAHLFGLGTVVLGSLFKIKGVLLRWFTADGFFDAVDRYRPNSTAVVPTMLTYMLSDPRFDATDWSSLRFVVAGAAPLPVEVAREFEKRTGARVLEGYGLTETSPVVSVMRIDDPPRPGSCGRPVPGIEVAILDDDGRPLPSGETGEVCVRGPNVMKGYFNMAEATAETIRDGWLHSGDMGHFDEDGYLFITERKKDLIIRGGFNIYPRDVEEVVYGHPAVQDCGVVGVPDPALGEQVVAYVVLRPGATAAEDEIAAYCREHLATYKTPRFIRFVDALPRNAIGKVLKKDLRERARQDFG